MAVIAALSVAAGLGLTGHGLWLVLTGRGSRLTPTAVARSGAAVTRWYGASWLPWGAYFLAGPWLLTTDWSPSRVILVSLGTFAVSCAFLLRAWRLQ